MVHRLGSAVGHLTHRWVISPKSMPDYGIWLRPFNYYLLSGTRRKLLKLCGNADNFLNRLHNRQQITVQYAADFLSFSTRAV